MYKDINAHNSTAMSALLHSDPGSSSSSTNSIDEQLEAPSVDKVPLSASIVLQKAELPLEKLVAAPEKISVRFQPISSAPALRPPSFKVAGTQTVGSILKFLMKRLRMNTVHVYVLSSFQPTPDEKLGDLHELFKTNGELILSYCEGIAFG